MTKLKVFVTSAVILVGSLVTVASPVFASNDNDDYMYRMLMQKCGDIEGTIVANYRSSWDWIVGFSPNQWGGDMVRSVGDDNYIQCFCPRKLNGFDALFHNGVQTTWLKASNASLDKQQKLQANGWLRVDNGADFGLAPEPYLAKNSKWDFAKCN